MAEDRRDRIAVAMGVFFTLAGLMHFASPTFFDDLVPPWLPPRERFWIYVSGVAELVVGAMLLVKRTRRRAAYAAMGLLVLVYPANLYMARDWRDRPASEQFIAYAAPLLGRGAAPHAIDLDLVSRRPSESTTAAQTTTGSVDFRKTPRDMLPRTASVGFESSAATKSFGPVRAVSPLRPLTSR
ncbi:MAG: MauE/DoxX family redox-associated membrane protein [Acidimicrobiales bacterium]